MVVVPAVLVSRPETVPAALLLKVPALLTAPVTVKLLLKVPPEVMPTVDVRLPVLDSVPAETMAVVKLLVPLSVSVLAPDWNRPKPVMLLAMLIAWPALAKLVRVKGPLLKVTADPVTV